ncbi:MULTISPECIES: hypothetical protein [Sulfolobaceae]|uniref:hypothetical protein n=1 Tax=Sulfolobaceae TaxID=118883 RepID=UPI001EE87660|nr:MULTISPECIES: hypothetical protein [unclassified Sulfolobus]
MVQKNEYGEIVSVSTYTLIKSNIVNSEEIPIIPKDFKLAKGSQAPISENLNDSFNNSAGGYILFADLIIIPLLIGVGMYENRRKKRFAN